MNQPLKLLILLIISLLLFHPLPAQTLNSTQQKLLNNYMTFANEATSYVNPMFDCFHRYHQTMRRYQEKKERTTFNLFNRNNSVCSGQFKDYYYLEALKGNFPTLNAHAKALREALEKIDKQAKEIEVYIRLEDYKEDNQASKSNALLKVLPKLFQDFRAKKEALTSAVYQAFQQNQPLNLSNPYHKAYAQMREILQKEETLLKSWNYNFNQEIHTGWIEKQLSEHIIQVDVLLRQMIDPNKLKYAADYQYKRFINSLKTMQANKRKALDDYNFEAKKSDVFSNQAYRSWMNYYMGTLISSFNSYVDYAGKHSQRFVYTDKFSPSFEFKSKSVKTSIKVIPFKDKPRIPISLVPQSQPISPNTFQALNHHVDFINEAVVGNKLFIIILKKVQKDIKYTKEHPERLEKGYFNHAYKDFKTPKSIYQQLLDEMQFIPADYRQSLTEQTGVMMEILKEMDELNQELSVYIDNKNYIKDKLKRGEEILQRLAIILDILDQKKEILYQDIEQIYRTYPTDQNSRWYVSSEALLNNVNINKKILFTTKAYCKGDSNSIPTTETLDALNKQIRKVIIDQYDNMQGIKKLGRNHGRCPYTPYEDIPKDSKVFMKYAKELSNKPAKPKTYEDFIYLYNNFIKDYNKFASLSETPVLKNIKQPDIFLIESDQIPTNNSKAVTEKIDEEFMKNMDGYATNNIVLLLDVSSSMHTREKLPLLKKSLKYLLGIMRPEDEISLVVYSGKAEVLLKGISSQEKDKIYKVIDNLQSGGNTNSEAGIKLAYKTADKNYIRGGNNRIIMATDGEFQVKDDIYQLVEKYAKEDISLSVFSFGKDDKVYKNLKQLSTQGKGNYEHINEKNADYKLVKEAKAKKAD